MIRLCAFACFVAVVCASSDDPDRVFSNVYAQHIWGNDGDGSGPGSTVHYTNELRHVLNTFIKEEHIERMVDAPCGSYHWMRMVVARVESPTFSYSGFDVVGSVIDRLNASHFDRAFFSKADITRDRLPQGADLLFSRDALQHMGLYQVLAALRTYQSADPRFLMVGSYPRGANQMITTGQTFLINLMDAPFALWPDRIISESRGDYGTESKHMMVYTQANVRSWDLDAVSARLKVMHA